MRSKLKIGDLVFYKQNLWVISKIHRGNQYVDLNGSIKVVPISQVKLLNLHQNLFHFSLLIHLCWNDDIKRLYLKRLAEKLPIHILKGLFNQLKDFGLTNRQHRYFFDRLYKEWTYQELIYIEEHIDEYNFTEKEKEIIERRIDYITFYKQFKVYYK